MRMLADPDSLLPWDDGNLSKLDLERLGELLRPIRKLLRRDPAQRATVHQFCVDLRNCIAN